MELEQKINSKPDKFSPESTLKIGNTKISLLKENSYMIESTGLLLDSINENMTHSHEHSHEHSKGQKHDKRVNMSLVSDVPSKSKTTKKTKKSLYDKIKMKFNAESVMPLTTFINKEIHKPSGNMNLSLFALSLYLSSLYSIFSSIKLICFALLHSLWKTTSCSADLLY